MSFAAGLLVTAATLSVSAAPAFARDDGPRLAQDRLDALVAQHQEANRRLARAPAPTRAPSQAQAHAQHSAS
jgi:hypothetical protein